MNHKECVALSRFISYILRHHPDKYGLRVDDQGFVSISNLLAVLNREGKLPRTITEADIEKFQKQADKKRFEISRGKIRATYGHSIAQQIHYEKVIPPTSLFHGTTPKSAKKIKKRGLLPMRRQFVHLSLTIQQAFDVGKRRSKFPVVLEIAAKDAYAEGIKFFKGSEDIFLVRYLPPKFISWPKEE